MTPETITALELVGSDGEVLAAKEVELDLDKLILELRDKPELLKFHIENYIASKEYSDVCLILTLGDNGRTWYVFEGMVNSKKKTFKVLTQIITFPANRLDNRYPPTQALNFIAKAAIARGFSVWLP